MTEVKGKQESESIHYVDPNIKEPIDIMVFAHGRLDLSMRCIREIYNHTTVPFHLIVIDDSDVNSSDPETKLSKAYFEQLAKFKNNVTYVYSEEPYKNGNQLFNIGLSHCKYEFVATVMNSIFVEPEWEFVALQFMKQTPDAAVLGFKCLFPTGNIESAGITMAGYTPVDLGRGFPGHRLSNIYEAPAAQWAFALLRRKAVEGNLDESIFHGFKGWDDIDNCFVMRKNGWKIYYCGLGVGIHEPRATRGSNTMESFYQNRENAEAFYKRWGFWEAFKEHSGKTEDYMGITREELEKQQAMMGNQIITEENEVIR